MTDVTGEVTVPRMAGREVRRQVVVLASMLLVLIAAVVSLFIVQGVDAQMQDIVRNYESRRQARDLIQALTDAESGQRGYLLTQDQAYLDPYRNAVATMDETYQRLIEMVADKPQQKVRLEAVSELIEQKRSEMATTIQMAREGRLNEALSILRTDAGRTLMDTIRSAIRTFIAEEDASLIERNDRVAALRIWLVAMILVALAGAVLLTYALFARTQKAVSQLYRSAAELRSQKIELERRVRERTAELEEARAHAERERARVEALLQDTNHRIGNSLATVSSLLGLQVARSRSEEARQALEAARNRVQAIASGHRRLRLGDDLETTNAADFITAVIDDLEGTQASGRNIKLETDIEPVTISARDATTLGIIVGELVMNALKHAFAPDASGTIGVRLKRHETGLLLEVEDDGRGMPAEETEPSQGLGAMIIEQLSRQFEGEVRHERPAGGGTCVKILLPRFEIAGQAVAAPEPGVGSGS